MTRNVLIVLLALAGSASSLSQGRMEGPKDDNWLLRPLRKDGDRVAPTSLTLPLAHAPTLSQTSSVTNAANTTTTNTSSAPTVPPSENHTQTTAAPSMAPSLAPDHATDTAVPTQAPTTVASTVAPTTTYTRTTPAPTLSPTQVVAPSPPTKRLSVGRFIEKTIALFIAFVLSLLAFGFLMNQRYRIYFFLRGVWYTILGMGCTDWILRKLRIRSTSAGYHPVDGGLNTVLFENEMNEGLLLRETDA